MVDKVKSQGGKKGAAIKAAKKQATETGSSIMLPEFGVFVDPTGDVFPLSSVLTEEEKRARSPELGTPEVVDKSVQKDEPTKSHLMHPDKESVAETAAVEEKPGEISVDHLEGKGFMIGERMPDGEYRHIARAVDRKVVGEFMTMMDLGIAKDKAIEHLNARHGDGAITEGTKEAFQDKGDRMAALAEAEEPMAVHVEEGVGVNEPTGTGAIMLDCVTDPPMIPNTILARANYYVENHGLSEADALSLAEVQLGAVATHPTISGAPATPGEGETLGPDKTMVEAYQKRMETYVAPRLECEIKVENPDGDDWVFPMPVRFLDYLLRSAEWETIKRRREVTPADRLQQILREYRRDDQEVRLLMAPGAASGPAGTFNPASGRWE